MLKINHLGKKNAGINQDESALSAEACGVDEDGDLILTRRNSKFCYSFSPHSGIYLLAAAACT